MSHGEDLDMWARLIIKYKYIGYSERKLVSYIHSSNNRSFLKLPEPQKHFAYHFDFNDKNLQELNNYYLQQVVLIMWVYLKNFKVNFFLLFAMKHKRYILKIFYGIAINIFYNRYKIALKLK